MTKPILNETQAEQNLAKPRVESNVKFEFGKELLTELQNNTFSERCEEDVIGHISKVLEILDLVKIAGVDPFRLRMKAFLLLLSKDTRKWWLNEGDGNITTWEEQRFTRIHTLEELEVQGPQKVDDTTKRVLLHTWIEIGNKEGLLNDEVSSDEEWEEHEYGNPPNDSFPKPHLNINNEKDKNHHNENNRDTDKLSGMDLRGAPHSEKINNKQPNEGVCRVDKFEVIKYTIGDSEEFLAICTRECDSWAQTVNREPYIDLAETMIPDISYDVHCLSQFMHSPLKSHLKIAFKILRYLKSCPGLGIHFFKSSGMNLKAFSDADWAKCIITRKSITGYCVFLNDSLVSWKIKKQNTLSKTKHLEIDLHFVMEKILKGVVKTVKVDSANQIANILSKGLDTMQHKELVKKLGMVLDSFEYRWNVEGMDVSRVDSHRAGQEAI
ncbi:hypothetical protein Tco_1344228 [Tanacetum coccineum]